MRAAALAFALGLAPACTILDAQADIQEVCVTYTGVSVPANMTGATAISQSFVVDNLGDVQTLASVVSDLDFVRAEARATSGITSFAFVSAAHVTVASGDPYSPLPTVDVYDCAGDCAPAGDELTVPSTVPQSALAYVASGAVRVSLELDGAPPAEPWTMDVDVCFRGKLHYQL